MKKLFKPLIAVVLLTGIFHNPLVAQTTPNETTTSSDRDRDNNNDNTGKWGLLGLLGLLGFVGMKKNERTGTYSTTNTAHNR